MIMGNEKEGKKRDHYDERLNEKVVADLEVLINNMPESFHKCFFRMIKEKRLIWCKVYKRAGVSKQRFYQVKKDLDKIPPRNIIIKLSQGAQLKEDETNELLLKAGYVPLARDEENGLEYFAHLLSQKRQEKGITEEEVCKRVGIEKSTMRKLQNNPHQRPYRETAIRLCVGCGLDFDDSEELLNLLGYTFSDSIQREIIITYFLKKNTYSICDVNAALMKYNLNRINA